MKQAEFEQFVEAEGKDILRFCRILTASRGDRRRTVSGCHAETVGKVQALGNGSQSKVLCLIYSTPLMEEPTEKVCAPYAISTYDKF